MWAMITPSLVFEWDPSEESKNGWWGYLGEYLELSSRLTLGMLILAYASLPLILTTNWKSEEFSFIHF